MIAALGLVVQLAAPAVSPSWRLSAEPSDTAEAALREAATRDGPTGLEALAAVSRQYPGSVVSGLAQLTAGLRLVDARRHADALACLRHPDIESTPLRDQALFAIGEAQEALGQRELAAGSYQAAAAAPSSGVVCPALDRAAELLLQARQPEAALSPLEQLAAACPRERPQALLALGQAQLARGDRRAAAAAFDRLDTEHTGSRQASEARQQLRSLVDQLPKRTPEQRARLALQHGITFLAAGRRHEALAELRSVSLAALGAPEADLARVSLARALIGTGHGHEGETLLAKIPAESPYAAEAAFLVAHARASRGHTPEAYESVADQHRGTQWGEEALLALAGFYQRDALDAQAFPWWRRLFSEYPDGRYVERAAWRVGWSHYRAGHYDASALILESTARLRPPSNFTAGFLYWAGRARLALNQIDRARRLLEETVQRFKHSYHGMRAREALAQLGGTSPQRPALLADGPAPEAPLPEPRGTRVRLLLLVERLAEAEQELRLLPEASRAEATIAWIDWRLGRYRPAVQAMKRAHPEWISEAGDLLPAEVWRILFPMRYEDKLRVAARDQSLDPALVASLILQESSFDPAALSRAGARGLMQVMPATGRRIARAKGTRFRRAALHDPDTSLDFGSHYLRQMSDRYAGSIEKVLAAYNAGPHRVDAWTAEHGPQTPEEFIETIPFTETRSYVMILLASREHYRRLYGLGRSAPGPVVEGARP